MRGCGRTSMPVLGSNLIGRRLARGQDNSVILSEEALGHAGFGGSIGFSDPNAEMSFGYTMNKMGAGAGLKARAWSTPHTAVSAIGPALPAPGHESPTRRGKGRCLLGAPRMERSRDAAWRWARAHHGSE
jgi:CubicO group peptidase (beta-lactamase class C family)